MTLRTIKGLIRLIHICELMCVCVIPGNMDKINQFLDTAACPAVSAMRGNGGTDVCVAKLGPQGRNSR